MSEYRKPVSIIEREGDAAQRLDLRDTMMNGNLPAELLIKIELQ